LRTVLLIWVLFVVGLSMLPLQAKFMLGTMGRWHTAGHFFVFLITALLAAWPSPALVKRALAAGSVLLFGVFLEMSEVVVYHNRFEWKDVATDACGTVGGLLLLYVFRGRLSSLPDLPGQPSKARH
jgi:peptidoglycan/LPS O-acetylase OafA/YrhL